MPSVPDNLTLHIVTRASGKPAIVTASRSLLQACVDDALTSNDTVPGRITCNLTTAKLAKVLEGKIRDHPACIS